jgi:hypothetical protein
MIIMKKAIPRRTFLKGAQAALALPLLDAMIPAATAWAKTPAKAGAEARLRLIPMGCDQTRGLRGPGELTERRRSCLRLEPVKDQLTCHSPTRACRMLTRARTTHPTQDS